VIVFGGRGILLDVEGTTSSIAFVYDVLFAYAKKHIAEYFDNHADDPIVRAAAEALADETDCSGTLDTPEGRTQLTLAAIGLMNRDVKSTALKRLQGMIWRNGFESGQLVSHVYDDVPPAFEQWASSGLDVRIYSSGSVEAQKLFFGHTAAGDLTRHLSGHYDTTTGPKREQASYVAIAEAMDMPARQILFVSDVGAELDAARAAGMATAAAMRPGNRPFESLYEHDAIESFAEITT
jgi:enolase-phosphatase E1